MSDDLTLIAALEDEASAEILAGLLRSDGIPATVRPISLIPGVVKEVRVYVPTSLADQAGQVINSAKVTDEELNFAATGETGQDEE